MYDYVKTEKELCLKINRRILNNLQRDQRVVPEIIGPANFYNDTSISQKIGTSCSNIRISTVSYWKVFGDKYYFIENGSETELDRMNHYMMGGDSSEIDDFEKSVIELNNKYDFEMNNENDVPLGFQEYKELYEVVFGRELKPIDDSEIRRVYLDIVYIPNEYDPDLI